MIVEVEVKLKHQITEDKDNQIRKTSGVDITAIVFIRLKFFILTDTFSLI